MGCGVCLEDGVFVYGWSASKPDRVLVNGMGYYCTGWSVSKRDGVLVNVM